MEKRALKLVGAVILVIGLITGLSISKAFVESRRAEAFLKNATALQLRSSTEGEVRQLSNEYGGHIESSTCDSHGCAYFVDFDNGALYRLRLAPYTRLTCTLGLENGVLVYRRVFLTTNNRGGIDFGAFVEEWLSFPKGLEKLKDPFDVERQTAGPSGNVKWRVHVNMTADASPTERQAAYDLNTDCLRRVGGCKDAQILLPSISWESSKDRADIRRN